MNCSAPLGLILTVPDCIDSNQGPVQSLDDLLLGSRPSSRVLSPQTQSSYVEFGIQSGSRTQLMAMHRLCRYVGCIKVHK